jgi:hypothetical protein
MKPKYLTKSRFKTGLECPNKVFFGNDLRYVSRKLKDPFLETLAQGGFQVEALARLHYPQGRFIDAKNDEYDKAHHLSREALTEGDVVLFEAGFLTDGLFIRTDILEKKGNKIRIIEVKAKSFDPENEYEFIGKRGGIAGGWKPYLYDLAFQKYVVAQCYPDCRIEAWLMLADKSKAAHIDGLNQMIRIPKDENADQRKDAVIKIEKLSDIGESLLTELNVDSIIEEIIQGKHTYLEGLDIKASIDFLRSVRQDNIYPDWPIDFGNCRKCEFRTSPEQEASGSLSGYKHCFRQQLGWNEDDFAKPTIMEIWNFRGKSAGGSDLIDENRLFMHELVREDFKESTSALSLSNADRQWLQVEKAVSGDNSWYVELDGLKAEMSGWRFPLHFIDFETSAVALPFTKGRRPYEQVAFQFSHHQYDENGKIAHKTEFLEASPGVFPNFTFARALKEALGKDQGSIFRFADHENTILNAIIRQLHESDEADKEDLISFLKRISHPTENAVERWKPDRDMVDLRKVVLNYYYNPYSKGSNSIKYLLPAALQSSEYLRKKYSRPIGEIALGSKNFAGDHIWLEVLDGRVVNPYDALPPLFDKWTDAQLEELLTDIEDIANGGAALTAYAKLQFTDMGETERNEIRKALLRYCELDTLAMVMIYEHLRFDIVEDFFG